MTGPSALPPPEVDPGLGAMHFRKTEGYKPMALLFGWVTIVGLFLTSGLVVFASLDGTTLLLLPVGLLMAGGGGFLLVYTLQHRSQETTLHEHCATQSDARRRSVVNYAPDLQVKREVTRHYTNFRYTHTTWEFAVSCGPVTARPIDISTDNESDAQRIDASLHRALMVHVAPSVLEGLNGGQCIDFGPLGLSKLGLSSSGESRPWTELHSLLFRDGDLLVFSRGPRGDAQAWLRLQLGSIPNLRLLVWLVAQKLPVHAKDPSWHARWFGV